MTVLSIKEIQGNTLFSAFDNQFVTTQGVVTGILRKGFYIQTPSVQWDGSHSDAIFVFGDSSKVELGYWVQVGGTCVNYLKHEAARPTTQIKMQTLHLLEDNGPTLFAIPLSKKILPANNVALALVLNSLEGMLVTIPSGATFIAPSNLFGDYVCALPFHFDELNTIKTQHNGIIVDPNNHNKWFPGFRLQDYRLAPTINVGAKLLSDITGPLHYRADSWQIAANKPCSFDNNPITLTKSNLKSSNGALTILTLNCFNLDPHIESPALVKDPRIDVDDDWGDARFHTLVQAIALQANLPDIIALQEIQDSDGAEISGNVCAAKTYLTLIHLIKELTGQHYQWVDIPPIAGADGGQPGGNIRNGFLYNDQRVELIKNSVQLIGENEACFMDSRKPLMASFTERASQKSLTVINVHLVSKRQQVSIFAPENAGFDLREETRIEQAQAIFKMTNQLLHEGKNYYITGDFNDHEYSATLQTLTGENNINLVLALPPEQRYDYNHRGKLQVLMHGIVPTALQEENNVQYDIIHGNELIGVAPGAKTDKPSDHAYVIAKIDLQ